MSVDQKSNKHGSKIALGSQPRPITGKRHAQYSNPVATAKSEHAAMAVKRIWIDHAPQTAIIAQLRRYWRESLGRRGEPISGRRLSQLTQAGKSATMHRLKAILAEERAREGKPSNEYQVVHLTLDRRMTLKSFYQELLALLGDEFYAFDDRGNQKEDRRSIKLLEQRITEFVRRLDVELLIIDEAQRLDRRGSSVSEVTERLQTWLDRGIVALVLVGNDKSRDFFQDNIELAARLGTPLELKELKKTVLAERKLFWSFCKSFDEAMVEANITSMLSGLDQPDILDGLIAVSGGLVGRVARLLQEAAPAAAWREAACIERYDLSVATRAYAIQNGWITWDPFAVNPESAVDSKA